MKLVFEETPFLPLREVHPGAVLEPATELELYVTPLLVLGGSMGPWRRSAMLWGLTPDHRLDVIAEKPGLSALEWPVRIAESVVNLADKVTEARITVFYILMEWGATVVLRGTPEQVAGARERAMTFMLSGRPDWTGDEVVALADLYAEPSAS